MKKLIFSSSIAVAVAGFHACDDNHTDDGDFVAVTGITGVSTVAEAGKTLTLTATVSPADATNKTIAWSVKSAGTTNATISGATLTTPNAGTVTVTATIAKGASPTAPFTADFSIEVKTAVEMPKVTSVTVSPATASVSKGASQKFTATVAGTGLSEADKTVNWTVTGGKKTATAIAADGTLTVAEDETATSLTVKATSAIDNTKSGTATVTVTKARALTAEEKKLVGEYVYISGSGGFWFDRFYDYYENIWTDVGTYGTFSVYKSIEFKADGTYHEFFVHIGGSATRGGAMFFGTANWSVPANGTLKLLNYVRDNHYKDGFQLTWGEDERPDEYSFATVDGKSGIRLKSSDYWFYEKR
jgi:hypothetical protein